MDRIECGRRAPASHDPADEAASEPCRAAPHDSRVTPVRAIVVGIVPGLTEFAPVSSSRQLTLTRWALGRRLGPPGGRRPSTWP